MKEGGIMESAVLVVIFLAIGIMGFLMIRELDAFLGENMSSRQSMPGSGEEVIKIACENPIMLSSVSAAFEKSPKDVRKISFCFYTGCKTDIERMIENESVDIVLLMEKMDIPNDKKYEEKVSSFTPSSLKEPLTGLVIEPIQMEQREMYVLWNERRITEKQRKLISNM